MQGNLHDGLFKSTFSQPEHAAGELRHVLPPRLTSRIDFATLKSRPGSFVDEALRQRHTDLLFSVTVAGHSALLYLLFEHQSSVDVLMPYRLLRYMLRIWEQHLAAHPDAKRLPAIVPVVLHHSESGWSATTAFEELLDVDAETLESLGDLVPRFRFVLDDISDASDETLQARAMSALARLSLWCLRHAREPGELVKRLGRWLDVVREAKRAPHGAAALRTIWHYILATNEPKKPEELVEQLLLVAGDEAKEEIVTAAEQLIERGRQEGRQEGHREVLLTLLETRFGTLSEAVVAHVRRADVARVDRWLKQVLTAPTITDALKDA